MTERAVAAAPEFPDSLLPAPQILELEDLPADPADTAAAAMRGRIRARFADLHYEREQLETQLANLAKTTPPPPTPPCSTNSRSWATSFPACPQL